MDDPPTNAKPPTLSPRERRVLGALVEKQKTTPDAYPMTLAGLTTACNQKSNRDPVTSYDPDDVEQTLQELRGRGAAVRVEGSGRVEKWKHNLYEWLDLRSRPVEMAILAELLLRGAQTEGELRARASRMDPIPDLDALGRALGFLAERGLVVYLTPAGQKRGAVVSHGFYAPSELAAVRESAGRSPAEPDAAPAASPGTARSSLAQELAELRERLERTESQLARLALEVDALRADLGA